MKYKLPTNMSLLSILFVFLVPFGGIIWFTYDILKQWRKSRLEKKQTAE